MSECIYKFVEQPQPKKHKKQIYRSKYDPNGPLIGSTFCMQGTTAVDGKGFHSLKKVRDLKLMFVVRLQLLKNNISLIYTQNHVVSTSFGVQPQAPNPKQFLRKGTRQCRDGARIPTVEHHNRNKEAHKPLVPSRDDKPVQ